MEAMQEMNDSVRNAVFFPAFFLTPVVLAAAITYLVGALIVTMAIKVPTNDDLANEAIPASTAQAQRVWDDYSGPWQAWNTVRTMFSGVSLVLAALGLAALGVDRTVARRRRRTAPVADPPHRRLPHGDHQFATPELTGG
jgi:Domain of unknown function (DUF1772)